MPRWHEAHGKHYAQRQPQSTKPFSGCHNGAATVRRQMLFNKALLIAKMSASRRRSIKLAMNLTITPFSGCPCINKGSLKPINALK
nr:hypothetical protein [uncultured Kingella sp.]